MKPSVRRSLFMLLALLASIATAQSCAPLARGYVPIGSAAQDSLPRKNPIRHIVIIVQENRTPDYLFQGLPGADISSTARDYAGKTIRLHPVSLAAGYDLGHGYGSFIKDYDGGKMDGFDRKMPPSRHLRPFGYAPLSEVRPYLEIAKQYVFGDRMFQSNRGPSFPAHLYLVSGTAGDPTLSPYRVVSNAVDSLDGVPANPGCDAPVTTTVETVGQLTGKYGPVRFPCFDRPVLTDFLDTAGVSWRYYQNSRGPGLWHAFDAIRHVRYGPDYKNVTFSSKRILSDVRTHQLADVSWLMPGNTWSDHAGSHSTTEGPPWVAAVVNAIGESSYWKDTAIFITWDDWGGWYDHVKPPVRNYVELGFRVPLIVVSPYAREGSSAQGYVDHTQHEFGSILAFTEETFGIPKGSLDDTDAKADDLSSAFDFTQKPRQFKHIDAPPFHPPADPGPETEDP